MTDTDPRLRALLKSFVWGVSNIRLSGGGRCRRGWPGPQHLDRRCKTKYGVTDGSNADVSADITIAIPKTSR